MRGGFGQRTQLGMQAARDKAAAQELNIEELQNAVAVRPTATQMNAAIADSKAALDDLSGMEF